MSYALSSVKILIVYIRSDKGRVRGRETIFMDITKRVAVILLHIFQDSYQANGCNWKLHQIYKLIILTETIPKSKQINNK